MKPPRIILSVALLLTLVLAARSQSLTFSTLAGSAPQGSADGSGAAARFANSWGVASDAQGNLYVADTENHTIRFITTNGVVSTLAGQAGVSGSANGTNSGALFNQPQGVAVDNAGNVLVADTGNHTIRMITPGGVVSTLAGLAGSSGTNNGVGAGARFYQPEGVAVDGSGTLIYVADTWNHTIRQVTLGGVVTSLAGAAGIAGTNNGTGSAAQFNTPQGITLDGAGNLYVGDTGNQTVRKVTALGAVTTLAGVAGVNGSGDGSGASVQFWGPSGMAVDGATNVYVADAYNHTIRKVTPAGVVSTIAGAAGVFGSADSTGSSARFWEPQGVAADAAGNIYVADTGNGTIRKIAGTTVTTVAGSASTGSTNGTGSSARFYWPAGSAIDGGGNVYVADTFNHTIRKIAIGGAVTTLAGSAGVAGTNNGSGGSALFNAPQGLVVDGSGNVYVADTGNHAIRRVTSGGAVTTFAGQLGLAGLTNGTGSGALFNGPQAVALDGSGNLYVADTGNHTVRKITSGGVVTTLAGVPGMPGSTDGGINTGTNGARFNSPEGLAVDGSGNVYVADTGNHAVRKVTSGGVVSTIAGQSGVWGSADGTNVAARFFRPQAITVDSGGGLFVLDSGNNTVRSLVSSGTNWVAGTVAGAALAPGSADGSGAAARFFGPAAMAENAGGTFAIADTANSTIRSGTSAVNSAPYVVAQPQNVSTNQGQSATFTVTAGGSAPLTYQWMFNSASIAGATGTSFTLNNAQPSNAGPYSVVVSNAISTALSSNALLTVIVAPAITNPPQDVTVTQGFNATFTVQASGTSPFGYQWMFNGSVISGATASSYTRSNAQPADAGLYAVAVANPAGTVTSSPPANLMVIEVPTPPAITAQPQNLTLAQGSNATFSVTATGSAPLYYQWLFGGSPIAGATGTSYSIGAQPSNAGPYAVVVSNAYDTALSSNAQLTVIVPPIISVQPANQLVAVSNSAAFSVSLSQGTSPAYQWRKNGTPISGATQSAYSLAQVTWSNAATYSVTVSNLAGSQTSTNAVLTVQQAAFVFLDGFEAYALGSVDNDTTSGPNTSSSNPWSATSGTAAGMITNSGSGILPHGGAQMLGVATNVTLRQDWLNLIYRLNAGSNYYGNFMCDWWFYDAYGSTPAATNLQEYLALCENDPVSSTADVSSAFTAFNQRMSLGSFNSTGYNYSNYQARIVGATGGFNANGWFNTTTMRSVGWHHARMIVGIPNAARLAPVWMYVDNMTNATFSYPSTGSNFGFNLIELNHAMAKAGVSGYYDDLTFRAANDPWIIEQPVSQTVSNTQSVAFSTVAIGTAYQWQFNGTNISGATSSSYSLGAAGTTNAGTYACLVSGTNGVLATSNAVLTVTVPPGITTQPVGVTVTQGQSTNFTVVASGTGPLAYQWRLNSTNIAGATDSSYVVASAQDTNAGAYSVVVTNAFGNITSSNAMLTVLFPSNAPPVFGQVTRLPSGAVQLEMTGTANVNYTLLFSSNWVDWTALTTLSSTNGVLQFMDYSPTNSAQGYYRLRQEP